MDQYLFHIATTSDWQRAQDSGAYITDSLASEGFIHCSRYEQVLGTAARFYAGRTDLTLLMIDRSKVTAKVLDEPADGDTFPHVYGTVALDAIVRDFDFKPDDSGEFSMPANV